MHILITDPHTDGGGQVRYIQSLVPELLRLGHRVTIGCRANSVLLKVAADAGCDVLPVFNFARGLRLRAWWHDLRAMARFMAEVRPDIVHVNGSQDHWVAGLAKALFAPAMCLVRSRHNTYRVKGTLVNRWLNRRLTTFQICVCEMVRETLAHHPAFRAERLTSIHNGVDASRFQPDASARDAARAALGYAPDHVVCGIVARLVEAKGHTYLFQAVEAMADGASSVRVLVFGQGALEATLREEVARRGLGDSVQFAGFRDRMERWIQAIDIGVLPSIDCDTSSFSLKEQMAAEIPVITSDYGGLTEIVTDGVEGIVVPHGESRPLAAALERLLHAGGRRLDMGRKGRERVLNEFTVAVFARKTEAAYERARELNRERITP